MSPIQPGSPQAQMPPGEDALIRKIQEMERVQREMLPSVALSIKPAMDDIRAQVADIAALVAAQIVYRTIGDGDDGMAVGATPTQNTVRTMTVPDGYTAAGLVVLGSADIVNTTASTQYVNLQAYAVDTDGAPHFGGAARITLAAGFAGSILAPLIRALDGLTPGMNLTFYVDLWASAAMGAHASNWTGIEVQAAFTR